MIRQNLLLLQDVDSLGRSGDLVLVKCGYARNFLLPEKKAVIADKNTLRMQQKLQEERAKLAVSDKKEADELVMIIEQMARLEIEVKVDPEGRMYGSVSTLDIVELLKKHGVSIEKKNIAFKKPIKDMGVIDVALKLKEGVSAIFKLEILPEGGIIAAAKKRAEDAKKALEEKSAEIEQE